MKKIIILIITLLLTGCYDYKELNDLGIVSAFGISKKDNLYVIDIQLISTINGSDANISKTPITVISGEGETLYEASKAINKKVSKSLFLSDINYVFISKDIIENDLEEVMDFFIRNPKLSLNFIVITSTENKSIEILSSLSHFNLDPASNLYETITKSEENYGGIYSLHVRDLINNYLSYGIDNIYPNVIVNNTSNNSKKDTLEDTNTNSYNEVKNMVFFKNGETIYLKDEITKAYNLLNNNIKNITITIPCNNEYFTIETISSKFNIKDNLNINTLNIKGNIKGEIVYYGCKEDLNNIETLNNITNKTEIEISNYLNDALKLSKQYKYDFLGLGSYIYKNNNKYFNFKKNNWNTLGLPNINIKNDIKVSLYKQGNLRGDL